MKPFVVIQTDFSLTWSAVSSMKGVMKIVDPTLQIEDITHDIKNFSPWEASMSLNTVEPYWPKGTVFVSVVDPGVGTSRKASVALLENGNYVVTPDNGALTHLLHRVGVKEIREIDETVNRFKGTEATRRQPERPYRQPAHHPGCLSEAAGSLGAFRQHLVL